MAQNYKKFYEFDSHLAAKGLSLNEVSMFNFAKSSVREFRVCV